LTLEFTATEVPALGLWEITSPAATVALDCALIVPTVREAAVNALVAAAWVSPITAGTTVLTGPLDTTRLTPLAAATLLPATGDWDITTPARIVALAWVVTGPATSEACMIEAIAED
jgi:hypothetical protein